MPSIRGLHIVVTNNNNKLRNNLREVFQCIRQAGLRLTMIKCQFGVKEVEFLEQTVSPMGVVSRGHTIQTYLQKLKFPRTKKGLERYVGSVNYYRTINIRTDDRRPRSVKKTYAPVAFGSKTFSPSQPIMSSLQIVCLQKISWHFILILLSIATCPGDPQSHQKS